MPAVVGLASDLGALVPDLVALHESIHGTPDQPGGFESVLRSHSALDGFRLCPCGGSPPPGVGEQAVLPLSRAAGEMGSARPNSQSG